MNLVTGLVPLETLSHYLSMESKNAPIGCLMRSGHQFEYGQLLYELVSGYLNCFGNSDSIRF
jgi:hypothetical protein